MTEPLHTTFTLVPIKTSTKWNTAEPRFQMVRLDDQNGYPSALFDVDTLAEKGEGAYTSDTIYNALYILGKTLKVRVTMEVIE